MNHDAEVKDVGHLLRSQIISECEVMATYALSSGLQVPGSVLQTLAESGSDTSPDADRLGANDWRRLAQTHDVLCHLVSPATPRTLDLLRRERSRGRSSALGPVALIRKLTITSIVLLAVFLLAALSPDVNAVSGDLFKSDGLKLAVNEVFLVSAAGIGAAFTALFTASRYVARGTYDCKYEPAYWIRFVLGLLAGIVLAALIPVKVGSSAGSLARPLLALIGGFSATVVFQILTSLVATLESLFQGNTRDSMDANRQRILAEISRRTTQEQLRLGSALVKVREQLAGGANYDRVMDTLSGILDDLIQSPGETPNLPSPEDRNAPDPNPPTGQGTNGQGGGNDNGALSLGGGGQGVGSGGDPSPQPDPPDPPADTGNREKLLAG